MTLLQRVMVLPTVQTSCLLATQPSSSKLFGCFPSGQLNHEDYRGPGYFLDDITQMYRGTLLVVLYVGK